MMEARAKQHKDMDFCFTWETWIKNRQISCLGLKHKNGWMWTSPTTKTHTTWMTRLIWQILNGTVSFQFSDKVPIKWI